MLERLLAWDYASFEWINGFHAPWLDFLMNIAGMRITWLPLYLFLLFILIRKLGWKSAIIFLFFTALLILCTDQISSSLIKPWVARFRPCHPASYFHGEVHLLNGKCGSEFGFISSHAANFWGLAGILYFTFRRKISWLSLPVVGVAILISWQRIYAGVHYPADVLGGMMLGIFISWPISLLYQRLTISNPEVSS